MLNTFKFSKIVNTIFEVARLKKRKKFAKKSIRKKVITATIILILLWIFGFYLYTTYQNIEVTPSNYQTTKTRINNRRTNCGK